MRARCELGFYPCVAPTGYLNDPDKNMPGNILVDPKRAKVIKEVFEKIGNESWSGRQTYIWLKDVKNTKREQVTFDNLKHIYSHPKHVLLWNI